MSILHVLNRSDRDSCYRYARIHQRKTVEMVTASQVQIQWGALL